MGSLTDVAENLIIDHVFGVTAFTFPSGDAIAIALGTSASDGGFVEVANTNGYARVGMDPADWNSAGSRTINTANASTFPTATGSWGTPDVWAIFDSEDFGAGNFLFYGDITTPTAIGNNDTPSFAAGELNLTFDASGGGGFVGFCDGFAHQILEHVTGKTEMVVPTIWCGFSTTDITDSGAIAGEATGGGYVRQTPITFDASGSGVADGATANSANITFPVTGTWTTLLDVVFLTDHATNTANANIICRGQVTQFSAVNGDTVQINIGDLDITLV